MSGNVLEFPTRGPRPIRMVVGEDEFDLIVEECDVYMDRVQLVVTLETEDRETKQKFARALTESSFPRPLS